METYDIQTYNRCVLVNITGQVREAVRKSGVKEGVALIASPHTTAGVTVNENADPDVCADILAGLEAMIPNIRFKHGEGNSDAHIKTSLMGISATVPVSEGEPVLGIWQSIYFCEFDGPRHRRFTVTVYGER